MCIFAVLPSSRRCVNTFQLETPETTATVGAVNEQPYPILLIKDAFTVFLLLERSRTEISSTSVTLLFLTSFSKEYCEYPPVLYRHSSFSFSSKCNLHSNQVDTFRCNNRMYCDFAHAIKFLPRNYTATSGLASRLLLSGTPESYDRI